jgi:hypothetical protein
MLPFTKLSDFQSPGPFYSNPMNCTYALLRYPKNIGQGIKRTDYFMTAEDIPAVLNYLRKHGYIVDTEMTKLLFHSNVGLDGVSESKVSGNRKMVCYFYQS